MQSENQIIRPPLTELAPLTRNLEALAERIKKRDQLAKEHAHAQWLENGRDLLKAKAILGHGNFEKWCEQALSYSPRTAQKLMRAAELCGPYFENESGSVLPKPTLIYALSAPSVSPELRKTYVPRVIAGEDVRAELRIAIKDHRDAVKKARDREASLAAKSPKAQKAIAKRKAREAESRQAEQEQHQIEQERQSTARSAAVALIRARLGHDLPALMDLVVEAGSGTVFSFCAERDLQMQLHALPTIVAEDDPHTAEPVSASQSDEGITPNENEPIEPVPMAAPESAIAESAIQPSLAKHNVDEEPSTVFDTPKPPTVGKFGNLASVVSAFPPSKRGPTHFEVPKRPLSDPQSAGSRGRPTPSSR